MIEDQLLKTILPADEVAAIVVEPVQGEAGYIVPPKEFLEELQRIAHRHSMLFIVDEVQSGMGRTGKMWASDHFGIEPDIFTVAKGIASGMPISATVANAEVMNWPPGAHASTFGGNPVSIAAALTTIELLEQELVDNAARMGAYMMDRMKTWPGRFPLVGDVRGLGLMIGIELVRDQKTKERAPEERDRIVDMAFERGLLILGAGENTLRLSPPSDRDARSGGFRDDDAGGVHRAGRDRLEDNRRMASTTLVPVSAYLAETWHPDKEYVDGKLLERNVGRVDHARLQAIITAFLFQLEPALGISVLTEVRVQVKATRFRIPDVCAVLGGVIDDAALDRPPFICIEILSKDDSMSSMQERIADFLDFGVPYLWVIDPRLKRCYAYTGSGMQTMVQGELVTENPEIRLPLAAIFG